MSENPGAKLFPENIIAHFPSLLFGRVWKVEHDLLLLKAMLKYELHPSFAYSFDILIFLICQNGIHLAYHILNLFT